MSVPTLTPHETRKKNLLRIAGLTMGLSLPSIFVFTFQAITAQNGYLFLVAGAFALVFVIGLLIVLSRDSERPIFGAWHLISAIILTGLAHSATQTIAGAEIGSALLILTMVIVIQTLSPEQIMRGAALGAAASIASGVLTLYSPIPQAAAAPVDLIVIWVTRGSSLVFLALIMTQFRTLNLAGKLLISFLGLTVLISLTFNILITAAITQTIIDQVGQSLQLRFISFVGTITAGVAALLSIVVSQRLVQPLASLTETANKVAGGNLNARASVSSQDEIGQLAETFNTMIAQLQGTLVDMEERVAERTVELEESSRQLQRRASQFEAIAQLARTITSIQDLDTLLPEITQLISQQFGFYHVGLFLIDESRQYAVLSAANSEGGQAMLTRKHRLGMGQSGIVGYVTATGNPRIALDTGADAVYFDNPDMPDTRSEMALPLRAGGTIIGALDIQSREPNAFSEEDVEVLSILADEVSIAIENARLYAESQRVLADAQSAFSEFTQEAWQKMSKARKVVGYELSGTTIRSLDKPVENNSSSKSIPIKMRNTVIGKINISLPEGQELDPDEMDITQALAERVGVAIESATLLQESRRRAARESMIGEISAKLSATAEIDRLMQVAVEELRDALGASEVTLKMETDNESE